MNWGRTPSCSLFLHPFLSLLTRADKEHRIHRRYCAGDSQETDDRDALPGPAGRKTGDHLSQNKTRAVISAIQQCIKRQKLETIKNPAGQRNWQEVVKVQEMKARLDIAPSAPVFLDTPVWQSNFLKKRDTVQEVNRTKNSLGLNLNFYPTRRKKD